MAEIESLREILTQRCACLANEMRRLPPAARAWHALVGVAAVAFGAAMAAWLVPTLPPPVVTFPSVDGGNVTMQRAQGEAKDAQGGKRATAAENASQAVLHRALVQPHLRVLRSPFDMEHPRRHALAEEALAVAPGGTQVVVPAPPVPSVRLVGIATSGEARRAILAVGGRQMMLAPGEACDGVQLHALSRTTADVTVHGTSQTLTFSGGTTAPITEKKGGKP